MSADNLVPWAYPSVDWQPGFVDTLSVRFKSDGFKFACFHFFDQLNLAPVGIV
jgi:hypothetical protein